MSIFDKGNNQGLNDWMKLLTMIGNIQSAGNRDVINAQTKERDSHTEALKQIGEFLKISDNSSEIDTTISNITSKYTDSPYPEVQQRANVIVEKGKDKGAEYAVYKEMVDKASAKYLGNTYNGVDYSNTAIKSLGTDFDYFRKATTDWTYTDIMNEMNFVNDFEILTQGYTDDAGKQIVDKSQFLGKYKSGTMTDLQLIDRISGEGGYKSQLEAALLADADDRKIQPHEAYYVFTGDGEGLETARTENKKNALTNIKSYKSAFGSIKKTINGLKSSLAKQSAKGKDVSFMNLGIDIANLNNLTEKFKNDFVQDDEGYPDVKTYIEDKLLLAGEVDPRTFIKDLEDEALGYTTKIENERTRYKKWAGTEAKLGKDEWSKIMEDKFRQELFGNKTNFHNIRQESSPPSDLEYDSEQDAFFSKTNQKYYSKESVMLLMEEIQTQQSILK